MTEKMNDGVPQNYVDKLIDDIADCKHQYDIHKNESILFFIECGAYGIDDPAEANRRRNAAVAWLSHPGNMERVRAIAKQRAEGKLGEAMVKAQDNSNMFWNAVRNLLAKKQGDGGKGNAD